MRTKHTSKFFESVTKCSSMHVLIFGYLTESAIEEATIFIIVVGKTFISIIHLVLLLVCCAKI